MGHQRLAGAGFAVDQDVAVGLPQIKDVFAQAVHHRTLPDQLFHQLAAIRQLAAQGAVVHHQTAGAGGLFGQLAHAVRVERLFKEIKRTDAHRLDRHRHVAVAGDHDHWQRAVVAHQFLQELHPVHAGHLDVRNHDSRIIRPQNLQRIFGAGKCFCVIARQGQPLADGLPHILFIIDNRDLHGLGHSLLRRMAVVALALNA